MPQINTIIFDADDTLWANETIFTEAQSKCKEIASKYISHEQLDSKLYNTEEKNIQHFGYGIKGFMLSMIETLVDISDGKVSGSEIHQILDLGKYMIQHPVELLPGVEETIQELSNSFELMIITKGDLFDQESKVARSGIADYFNIVEVVSDKTARHYQNVLKKHSIEIQDMIMVGNSVKSDIIPICELGGLAVHIPFHTTWAHETVKPNIANEYQYTELPDISLLADHIKQTFGLPNS